MLRVYNTMALGLAVTGIAALGTANLATTTDAAAAVATMPNGTMLTSLGAAIYLSPLRWVIMLAPLAAVFFLSFRIQSLKLSTANAVFWGYAAMLGVSLSSIFLVFTGQSIVQTFFVTAAAFGSLSLYGYTTKRDLTGMGSFLFMGVIGLLIASIVNIFLQSSAMQFAISAIGVLVFAGLTAYDTQDIKNMYYDSFCSSSATANKRQTATAPTDRKRRLRVPFFVAGAGLTGGSAPGGRLWRGTKEFARQC
ncbi:MAG: Bax inhibitor-1/YccA family protein [Rhizobiaceae bacterium]|nr:Bax inhibitor-1/YccA family protein [Rhizobiaceae bacterium]